MFLLACQRHSNVTDSGKTVEIVESIQVQPMLGAVDTRLAKSGLLVEPIHARGNNVRWGIKATVLRTVLRTLLRVGYESVATAVRIGIALRTSLRL